MTRFHCILFLAAAFCAPSVRAQAIGYPRGPAPSGLQGRYSVGPQVWRSPSNRVITWDGANGIAVNSLVGAERFYNDSDFGQATVIANVEAGRVWNGHETLPGVQDYYVAPDALGDFDMHATWVGMVLAGLDPTVSGSYPYYKLGMAPWSRLSSGAIATQWYNSPTDPSDDNVYFDISPKSFYSAYNHYFTKTWTRTLDLGFFSIDFTAPTDVINSSWGYEDPLAVDPFTKAIDGFARAHAQTTMVVAAGNSNTPQNASNNVGGPASASNVITVGATGNGSYDNFSMVADFSSRGPQDFYNPATNQVVPRVRAPVDLVAPGTSLLSAFYGGQTGGNGAQLRTTMPDPSVGAADWYSWGLAGTSFAAPTVAGGVALLKTYSYYLPFFGAEFGPESRDTRVIKAVLMNSATKLPGWDNGQHVAGSGVIVTTQSLDWAQGTGTLNLDRAYDQYLTGTADVPGTGGGPVLPHGWDYGAISLSPNPNEVAHNDYPIQSWLLAGTTLDVTLSWFRNRGLPVLTDDPDPANQSLTVDDLGFANLDLEVWNAALTRLYATSMGRYNDVEHLHFTLPDDGLYTIRVTYPEQVYGTAVQEVYGLAWAVPEPSAWALLLAVVGAFGVRRSIAALPRPWRPESPTARLPLRDP